VKSWVEERQASGEDGAAERGGDSPEERGGGNEEIAAERMRR